MHLGVLATASHAVLTQTIFVVYYKPRYDNINGRCVPTRGENNIHSTSCLIFHFSYVLIFFRTSQFIVSLNKYLEAMKNKFALGMRYKMRFEGEDAPERR